MSDAYNAGLRPEEGQQPRQQQRGGSPYDGMIAQNAQGQRVVYRSNASGQGRWVEVSPATADAASREALENENALYARLRDTSRLAEDFIEHNRKSGTGGMGQSSNSILGLELGVPAWGAPHRQAMQGLSAEMVRSNIRPGMAQTMNSDAEAMLAGRTYPSEDAGGDVNAERAVRILVNRDMQAELIRQMEAWLRQHPSIAGFQEQWRQQEPALRSQLTRMHVTQFGSRGYNFPNLNERGVYEPGAGRGRRAGQDDGGAIQFERDPQTGEIRRARR